MTGGTKLFEDRTTFRVPVLADAQVGRHFGDMTKLGFSPTEDQVRGVMEGWGA